MSTLALLGGEPITRKPFGPLSTIGQEEKQAVMEVLDSGVLSGFLASPGEGFLGGPRVRALEAAWCERFGVRHAVAMNSATSALYAAVTACGVEPGDEVINSPLTMVATPSAALVNHAVPVFADIDRRTMNLDPASVARCITERTRAIFVVHLAGHPCDMDPILELARAHDLAVLEDNAQAPGALYRGREAGCIGDIGVYSLNCHKTIQCGEGGVAVTNDDDLALRLQLVRNHGEKLLDHYDDSGSMHLVGQNYRMTEMEAAVAFHQLQRLDGLNEVRTRLGAYCSAQLRQHCNFIEPPYVAPECTHVYYVYHMEYDAVAAGLPIELFAAAVRAEGIPLNTRWGEPLYDLRIYQEGSAFGDSGCPFKPPWALGAVAYPRGTCPEAEAQADRSLFVYHLIAAPNSEADVDLAIQAMAKVQAGRQELLDHSQRNVRATV
jgi:dTDP-4-amino-4,6-dideoxygalactose transaminase